MGYTIRAEPPDLGVGQDIRFGVSVRCPYCNHDDLRVVDSRDSETGEAIRRRRACNSCGKRFTTYERIESIPFYIVKKDGRREDFDRAKLFQGLMNACKKRDISPSRISQMVEEIEAELRGRGHSELPSVEVGELVMEHLRLLDDVAYVRFASVYRSFRDVSEVRNEIDHLLRGAPQEESAPPPVRRRSR
ncbi:MAG: transcriptional regulator NrdR [Candidatus Dormibacteria bacterium]|jgi:transcriptional repressor NrdR